jgi:Kef-type K+ transport system membrane component KefB
MAVEAAAAAPSLPYHEPSIPTILIQSTFLLLLNVVSALLDRLVYCGLLGQVLIGIAWGTPGAKWLSIEAEEVIVQLGYLGLILLVYEGNRRRTRSTTSLKYMTLIEAGGLSTSFKSLKANLLLSSAVALTGIIFPIGLSYTLQGLLNATPIQAFAAGAALCSTSLGTTFTVLASSGLSSSRLGVVLTSAAMMDDVVGLVMVQVISNLGGGDVNAITIVRPILVSIAFAVMVPLACRLLVKPLTLSINNYRAMHPDAWLSRILQLRQTAFSLHTGIILVLVASASYAGTSNLFAAYIAGASISWWDSELPHRAKHSPAFENGQSKKKASAALPAQGNCVQPESAAASATEDESKVKEQSEQGLSDVNRPQPPRDVSDVDDVTSGSAIYERYYQQAVGKILQPFFFASIGFSIPITRMFQGQIVWRGIVYTILMTFGKVVCGLWLVRLSVLPTSALRTFSRRLKVPSLPHFWGKSSNTDGTSTNPACGGTELQSQGVQQASTQSTPAPGLHTSTAPKPFSLHPPLILACAMTARGEIGFLISAVAESKGVFSASNGPGEAESDIFLVVTWAIVLCTIIGPLGVGLAVRRVKTLEERKNREQEGTGRDVLGVWGVK